MGCHMNSPRSQSAILHPVLNPGSELRWPASGLWRDGEPEVRKITVADVRDALAQGTEDFREFPTHAFFACIIYPVVGLLLARLFFGYDVLPLIYPMAAGFALLGPFVAIGLYELSRRRELGLDNTPARAFDVLKRPGIGAILLLGLALTGIFVGRLYTANLIHTQLFGGEASTPQQFWDQLTTTAKGTHLIVVGNVVGFVFALVVLVTSVVSFPMLVDRDVSAGTAVRTSIRAALENPVPVAVWGLIVVIGLVLGAIPFLLGLAFVLPILGHATWHLYRKLVVPEKIEASERALL